jgi:hypothetical protein
MSKIYTDNIEKRTGGTAIPLPSTGKWPAANIADDAITADKILADSITTAKILDNNVTLAKMADDSVGVAELSATGTASATTYLRGDNTWGTVTTSTQTSDYKALWRMNTMFSGSADPVLNWSAQSAQIFDPKSYGLMVEATGIWTFPTTGFWEVHIHSWHDDTGSNGDEMIRMQIYSSIDTGSNYIQETYNESGWNTDYSNYMGGTLDGFFIADVTNTSTYRIKFRCYASQTNMRTRGGNTSNETYAIFTRLGDT